MTATRPATQPDSAPSSEGLPLKIHSANIQDSAAAAVATNELIIASGAPPIASRLEPALKPNQPTHSSEAPIMVMTSEWGGISSLPKPMRLPTHERADQAGDAGVDVHDGAAGEVDGAPEEHHARRRP